MKKILVWIIVIMTFVITPVYALESDFEISDEEWKSAFAYLEENREMLEEFAKDLSFESDDPAELSDFLRENAVYYRPYWPAVSTIQTDRLSDLTFDTPLSMAVSLGNRAFIILSREKEGYKYGNMTSGDLTELFQRKEVEKTVYEACGEAHPVIWLIKFWQIHGTAAVAECADKEIIVPIGEEWKKFYDIDQKWFYSEEFIPLLRKIGDPDADNQDIQKARSYAPVIAGGIAVVLGSVFLIAKKKKGLE
ncbi:MAG: hypothetical protein II783_07655 [Erysipelotrichales bacterium]|nr:hypothetical protein [Erysipelotrichales bacterium]